MPDNKVMRLEWDKRSLRKVESDLKAADREFRVDLGLWFLELIRHKIRSRTGTLARSWKVYPRGDTLIFSSNTPYSWASVKGNWIRPTRRKALAFEVAGSKVFAAAVRYGPGAYLGRPRGAGSSRSYLDEAATEFPAIAHAAFGKAYADLG